MRETLQCCRQRCIVVLLATGLLVVGHSLQRADAQGKKPPRPSAVRAPNPELLDLAESASDVRRAVGGEWETMIDLGSGDYRAHTQREWILNGGGNVSAAFSGPTGVACQQDADCNDCNSCTLDRCDDSVCVGGRRNGQGCTEDEFCEGVCDGGVDSGQPCTTNFDCCGNGFEIPDGVCAFNPCVPLTTGGPDGTGGRQCVNALLPDGQFFTEGECNDGLECNGRETCDSATSTCVAGDPLVAFVPRCDAGANVGLACDPGGDPNDECPPAAGEQDPGACVPTPFTCQELEQLCDEGFNRCRVACITDEDCNDDGNSCTLDRCDPKSCVGGQQDGQLCRFNADCDNGDCSGGGTGGCVVDPNPCGSVAGCSEGSICVGGDTPGASCITASDCGDVGVSCPPLGVCAGGDNDGNPCTSNAACPLGVCTGNLSCRAGRCCTSENVCLQVNREVCTGLGGAWLFTNEPCQEIATGSLDDCPSVGSGIAPPGNTVVNNAGIVVGPGAAACGLGTTFERIGDDYKIGDGIGFVEVRIVRLNIDEITGTRLFLEFWDTTSDVARPIFIEDALTGGAGDGTNTFIFSPPLAIPKTGVFAISVARAFTDTGSFAWRSTGSSCFNPGFEDDGDTCVTDADCSAGGTCLAPVDVGDNDPNVMFVDGQMVTDFLGQCSGGANDGTMCDRRAGNLGCPGGTCVDVPDVLRFELVTTDIGEPLGGCCDAAVGSCAQTKPWICIDQGNVFRGVGIGCAVCFGGANNALACTTDADCPDGTCSEQLCLGDPQTACATDPDCGANGPCVAIAQCSAQACCDPDGSCVEVQGQGSSCPVGTNSLGFATGCSEFFVAGASPNACPQPEPFPGADNCRLVNVQEVPIPSNPNTPFTLTITGNNGDATFDDWFTGTCDGGARHGLSCDPEALDQAAECPDNPSLAADEGTCIRLCNSGSFDVFGGTQDPGWWDGIHISECANIRFDNCTSDPFPRGQWPQLYQASDISCCAAVNGQDGVDPPIGIGIEGAGSARGGPFCRTDALWWTHGLLAPGTYFMPTFGDDESENHAAIIVGGTGLNDYQLHVTVAPCPVAACCVNLCDGGTRTGEPCSPNGIQDCPGVGARCSNGSCVGGTLDGFACSEACPGGGRCIEDSAGTRTCAGGTLDGSTCLTASIDLCPGGTCGARSCTETNEPMCGVMEGAFLAGPNFPKNRCVGGVSDGSECDVDDDCLDGACVVNDPIVSCIGSPCEEGSCCIGDGTCVDRDPNGVPLTKADCDVLPNGVFTGGARCLGAPSPCPQCPLFSEPGKCMLHSGLVPSISGNRRVSVSTAGGTNFADQSDRSNGFEVAQANDFIARGSLLTQFCFFEWRFGNVLDGCASGFAERWIIKFYEDVDGVPGALLPDSPSTCPTNKQCDDEQDWVTSSTHNLVSAASGMFGDNGFDLSWDYTLTLDPPIQLVPGNRYWVEVSNDTSLPNCQTYIFMAHSDQDNDWKMEKYQPRDEYSVMSNNSTIKGTDGNGLSMCLDFADWDGQSIRPDTPTGSCCRCNGGVCTDDVEWRDCMFPTSVEEERNIGTLALAPCALSPDCLDLGSGGSGCPGAPSGVEGEDCVFPRVVSDGNHLYNTACSTTDGRPDFNAAGVGCDSGGTTELFLNDQWFEYHASCTGNVGFDLCENSTGSRTTTYDTIMAVYTNGTSQCPTECPPPIEFLLGGECENNVCNADSHLGVPSVGDVAVFDQCYIIRVGGEPDNGDGGETIGIAALEVFCDGFTCPPSEPAEIEQVVNAGGGKVDSVKNRYLSFNAGEPGREEGIRIKIIDAPAPFELWANSILWVGAPRQLSELSGKDDATPPTFTTANLECLEADAAFIDWNAQGTIHVSGPAVIPGATYEIQVVDTDCNTNDANSFPPERAVQLLTGRWGDAVGPFNTAEQTWSAPNGSVDVGGDVVAILDKFKNAPTAPIKSRSDIQPNPVDSKITIVDVTRALDAFSGAQFPFPPADSASPCASGTQGRSAAKARRPNRDYVGGQPH